MTDSTPLEQQLHELWPKVPEEERLQLLAYTKSKALENCALLTVIGGSTAIGLQMPGILLAVLVTLPILYQVVAARLWLEVKPRTLIQYFVASLTASRFAQSLNSSDPSVKLIFKGSLQPVPLDDDVPPETQELFAEELESEVAPPRDVWISLFPDSLVMISESDAGARLEFGHSTLNDFAVALDTPEDTEPTQKESRLLIQTTSEDAVTGRWVLSSPYPSMLVACERKIRFFAERSSSATSEPGTAAADT